MTRPKSKRKNANQVIIVDREGPTRHERLADPDSYENRKKRAMKAKKIKPSVYQKEQEAKKKSEENGQDKPKQGGRLADKIRKLNAQKEKQAAKNSDESSES